MLSQTALFVKYFLYFFISKDRQKLPVSYSESNDGLYVHQLNSVHTNTRTHGAGQGYALQISALNSSGLSLHDCAQDRVEVLLQLFLGKGSLTYRNVYNVGLVQTVLNLTCLDISDCLRNIHGYGTSLGVGHQTLRAQNTTQTTNNTHHIGGRYNYVKVQPAFVLNAGDQILSTYVISASGLSLICLYALSEYQHANGLTGSVRQYDSATDLLICMTSVTAGTDVCFDGLVKLCGCVLLYDCDCFSGIVLLLTIYVLSSLYVFLSSFISAPPY